MGGMKATSISVGELVGDVHRIRIYEGHRNTASPRMVIEVAIVGERRVAPPMEAGPPGSRDFGYGATGYSSTASTGLFGRDSAVAMSHTMSTTSPMKVKVAIVGV